MASVTDDRLRAALMEWNDPVWTDVEQAIWPKGPARGHGSGAYAALKAKVIAVLAATPALAVEDARVVEWLRASLGMDEEWASLARSIVATRRRLAHLDATER